MSAIGSQRGERIDVAALPYGTDHAVPGIQRALREGASQARADARDEEGLGQRCGHATSPGWQTKYIMI